MTYNPRDPSRTSGGSSTGSAALVAAGVVRPRARHRHRRLDPDPRRLLRHRRAEADVRARPGRRRVPALAEPATTSARSRAPSRRRAALLEVLAGVALELRLRRAADRRAASPARRPGPDARRARPRRTRRSSALAAAGFEIVDVDVPELDLVDEALGAIVLREAWDVHRERFEREADGYGPGTRALLELGARSRRRRLPRGAGRPGADRRGVRARLRARSTCSPGRRSRTPAPPEDPPFGTPEGDVEGRFTGPYNLAGIPAVSLPCGLAEGTLPAGLQLAAAAGDDALLLSVAAASTRRSRREDRGLQLDAARGVPAATTTGSCCRSARSSSTATCRSAST